MADYNNDFQLQYEAKKTPLEILGGVSSVKPKLQKSFLGGLLNQESENNRLFWGDNLKVLRYLLEEEQLKGKVNLIYIDPPFSTKQSFKNSDNDHAYDDLLSGAEYLEFIRERLVFLKEL